MAHRIQGRIAHQIQTALQQLSQGAGLPFLKLLDPAVIREALQEINVSFRDRLYTPWVTLGMFLSQVLDPVHCCLQVVARLVAHRVSAGLAPCSPRTGGYCQARQRLPEGLLVRLLRRVGRQLHEREMPAAWLWKGRPVKIADGTTVSMPDTEANQARFPQSRRQKPGTGFPLARLVVIFSLAVGTVLDGALAPYKGKGTGELSLLRQLQDSLEPGDILLGDRIFCSFLHIALLLERGIDVVVRLHQRRHADFRRGQRLGKDDHRITWTKPTSCPDWLDQETYDRLPATLTLRELRVRVPQRGFRTKTLVVVTSLLDPLAVSARDVAELYRARWHAELDLRSLKQTLQMDVLRCQTPEMVAKEVWAHLLAYNLVRQIMAEAAAKHGILPRELSFKSALETLWAFAPHLLGASAADFETRYHRMLDCLVCHRIGDRPNRSEPRVKKRRPKNYPYMQEPRASYRPRKTKV